jgi:HEAT repeats
VITKLMAVPRGAAFFILKKKLSLLVVALIMAWFGGYIVWDRSHPSPSLSKIQKDSATDLTGDSKSAEERTQLDGLDKKDNFPLSAAVPAQRPGSVDASTIQAGNGKAAVATASTTKEQKREVALEAMHAAVVTYDPNSLPLISPYLNDEDEAVRAEALNGMLQMGEAAAAPLLRAAADKARNPREALAMLDAADFLELPSVPVSRLLRKKGDGAKAVPPHSPKGIPGMPSPRRFDPPAGTADEEVKANSSSSRSSLD